MSGSKWMKILHRLGDVVQNSTSRVVENKDRAATEEVTQDPGPEMKPKSDTAARTVQQGSDAALDAGLAKPAERSGPERKSGASPNAGCFSLLSDPLLSWEKDGSEIHRGTLPELFANLANPNVDVTSFPHLRPHQAHAWHAFLVQTAALALRDRSKESTIPRSAESWRDLLTALVNGSETAWCLVEENTELPAFFQPPIPKVKARSKATVFFEPDGIDVLVTSKSHDVKQHLLLAGDPEYWVYALVTAQTMGGYEGRGINGIVRMSGGYGCRAGMALTSSLLPGIRFRRDLQLLRDAHDRVAGEYGWSPDGIGLLWLVPWDGDRQVAVDECDPWVVEVCRLLRVSKRNGGFTAQRWPTTVKRISAEERNGHLGDPWIPLEHPGKKDETYRALFVSKTGFDYKVVSNLLFDPTGFPPPLCGDVVHPGPDDKYLLLEALSRGQGNTEGFHRRVLLLPKKIRLRLGAKNERERLGRLAKDWIRDVDKYLKKVLYPALASLLHDSNGPTHWVSIFRQGVDACFFDELWRSIDSDDASARNNWITKLDELGRQVLDIVSVSPPVPSARRYEHIQKAWNLYYGGLKKRFPTWWATVHRQVTGAGDFVEKEAEA